MENCSFQSPPELRPCSHYGTHHSGRPCDAAQIIYYSCQKSGHIARNCKQWLAEPRPKNQGRVFPMTHEEVLKSPKIIQGTILLNGNIVQALFDSSARHSFIAFDCVRLRGLKIHKLPYDLIMSMLISAKTVTTSAFLNCMINVEKKISMIYLRENGSKIPYKEIIC